ncbi:MAG: B12-binding domain-containing radical SAM protein [Deltaproteobacteria bacterium]|nr:B12-binding domain-containing radical SAM protein [Deltaproteobacteria bacterium]
MKTKVLMVYPKIPHTFWSFDYILRYFKKRTAIPPLGLLTLAALMPDNYDIRLVDMNAYDLTLEDLIWADMVFISAMSIQEDSFNEVVDLCCRYNKIIVAGGPLVFSGYHIGQLPVDKIDHLFFNEAETTLPEFLKDFEAGHPKRIYRSETKPDISNNPLPRYDLIDVNDYWFLPLQFSRGCPFNCDFCEIIEMNGRQVRTKTPEQVLAELDIFYQKGFTGIVFFVDDNFIGNIKRTKEMLVRLLDWQREKRYPFSFATQVSLNIANDEELLTLMANAGFITVFVGIESPDKDTLIKIQKSHNAREDLLTSVKKIQAKRIIVYAGFIIGFDSDSEAIFDRQIEFIQQAGIPIAMVGLLLAMPNTQLFQRLKKENRLIGNGWTKGNNVDLYLNYIPKMPEETLIEGYKRVLAEIYKPRNFYDRFLTLLEQMPKTPPPIKTKLFSEKTSLLRVLRDVEGSFALLLKEIFSSHGIDFIRFIYKARKLHSAYFWVCVGYAANGRHYFEITEKIQNTKYTLNQR